MRGDVAALLRCPHCGGQLVLHHRVLRCSAGHAFDVARQGYVNLLPGGAGAGTADTAAMVAAREAFLAAGHYDPLVDAVAATAATAVAATAGAATADAGPGCAVDVGAGTGRYLAAVLDRLVDRVGLALDLSKHAARRAARAHPRIGAAVCDVWRPLPVRSGVAAVAVNVFAPRAGAELARVLRRGGALVVVTPTPAHLAEVTGPLGLLSVDERKEERLAATLGGHFAEEARRAVEFPMALPHRDLAQLAAMGPSAWHTDPAAVTAAIADLDDPVAVTASVTLSVHRSR